MTVFFLLADIEIYGGHEHTNIVLEDIPNPREVEDMIDRIMVGEEVGFKPQGNLSVINTPKINY